METRLVIFLALTSFTLILNTLIALFAYKKFAQFTGNLTETIQEFETSSTTRVWIASLQSTSEQAVTVTETAKQKFVEYDSVMDRAQSRYGFALAKVDTRMASFEKKMLESTKQIKETIEGPASRIGAVAAGIKGVASQFGREEV